MSERAQGRLEAVRAVVEASPDAVLRKLDFALRIACVDDAALSPVRALVRAEADERRTRDAVFAPILPLCRPLSHGFPGLRLPSALPALAWRRASLDQPRQAAEAVVAEAGGRPFEQRAAIYDALCLAAADSLRGSVPDEAAALLALAPVIRAVAPKLDAWRRTLSAEHAAVMRLAYKDAGRLVDDGGPLLIEALYAHWDEPWRVLRLISAVMDRPSDGYLAASELGGFVPRLFEAVEARVEAVRRFDPDLGADEGERAARAVWIAADIVAEFEQWIVLTKGGPAAVRLAGCKRTLATAVEGRLREVQGAVDAALPTQSARLSGRLFRRAPKLARDPDPRAVARAQSLLSFLDETRVSAPFAGFGALRGKVLAALDAQLETYAEELIDELHQATPEAAPRLRAYLDLAAGFIGRVKTPKSADIVRRRMAAA